MRTEETWTDSGRFLLSFEDGSLLQMDLCVIADGVKMSCNRKQSFLFALWHCIPEPFHQSHRRRRHSHKLNRHLCLSHINYHGTALAASVGESRLRKLSFRILHYYQRRDDYPCQLPLPTKFGNEFCRLSQEQAVPVEQSRLDSESYPRGLLGKLERGS